MVDAYIVRKRGYFGQFGGQYVPETLMPALHELEAAYEEATEDPAFLEELESYYRHYGGRPTPLYLARRLTDHIGGAQIYLKREDLCHGGAHKFNNVMGQALLARVRPDMYEQPATSDLAMPNRAVLNARQIRVTQQRRRHAVDHDSHRAARRHATTIPQCISDEAPRRDRAPRRTR